MLDLTALTPEQRAHLGEIIDDPLAWSELLLRNPETGEPFQANYVQQQMFCADRAGELDEVFRVAVRVHRRAGKTYGLSVLALHGACVYDFYEVLVIAPDQGKVDDIFTNIRAFIEASPGLGNAVAEDTKSPQRILFKNGSVIQGKTTGSAGRTGGKGVRGKGADLVIIDETAFLAEGDFRALNPIIRGDKHRQSPVRTYASSTPEVAQGQYYEWCLDHKKNPKDYVWAEVHIPLTSNPEYSEADCAQVRRESTTFEWETEYLAEFPNVGDYAIRETDLQRARRPYAYVQQAARSTNPRAMGVDWDRVQAGVNIAIVEYEPGIAGFKTLYREEVPRSEFTFRAALDRIKALNKAFEPDWIYLDRGNGGDSQVEELRLYGKRHPETRLYEKCVGVHFKENVQVKDPISGKMLPKMFKVAMVNQMLRLFENGQFIFPETDEQFEKQLRTYKIVSLTQHGFKMSSKDEHIIDAVGLACYALFSHSDGINPLKSGGPAPAKQAISLPRPQVAPSAATIQRNREFFQRMSTAVSDRQAARTFGRGNLTRGGGSSRISRTRF